MSVVAARGAVRRNQTKPGVNTALTPATTAAAVLAFAARCATRKTAPASVRDMSTAATPRPVPVPPVPPATRLSTKLVL